MQPIIEKSMPRHLNNLRKHGLINPYCYLPAPCDWLYKTSSTGCEPVTSRNRCDALTNYAIKLLTLGAGHLWVLMSPWGMNVKWYMKYFIYWTADVCYDLRIYERNLCNCVKKHEKVRTSIPVEVQLSWDHSLLEFTSAVQYVNNIYSPKVVEGTLQLKCGGLS